MALEYSLSDMRYIERMIVGNPSPDKMPDENKMKEQLESLNYALSHGGRIIGQEKNFYLINLGEHQAVLQYIVYHVGFERKPYYIKNKEN